MNDSATVPIETAGGEATYKIGAVSRLTRIPAPTLRMWERRYSVVVAQRTAKHARLYSKADIARLGLIKQLVDLGNAISTLAHLRLEQLRAVKASYDGSGRNPESVQTLPRVMIMGEELSERLHRSQPVTRMLNMVGLAQSLGSAGPRASELRADIAILDVDSLDEGAIDAINAISRTHGLRNVIVVYANTARRTLQRAAPNLSLVRRPVNVATLVRLCLAPAINQSEWASEWLGEHPMTSVPPKKIDDPRMTDAHGI